MVSPILLSILQAFVYAIGLFILLMVLYSIPDLLGNIIDRFHTRQVDDGKSLDHALAEKRYNKHREEGKAMDGVMYYQQKGY